MNTWHIDPLTSDDDGVVAVGLELAASRVLEAYRQGVFPFFYEGADVQWRCPNPRAILPIGGLRTSRIFAKAAMQVPYEIRMNTSFQEVIAACAANRPANKRWLISAVINTYSELHAQGWAHSIEVWSGELLVGGLYGVAIGAFFSGESMFSRIDNGSKIALGHLMLHLQARGYQLFDIQILNAHTRLLGGIEVPRHEYLTRLNAALVAPVKFVDL